MAQMTESLAQAIINGAGVTRNELEQLARCWISNHLSAQAKVRVTDEMESDLALIAQACTGPISSAAFERLKAALSNQLTQPHFDWERRFEYWYSNDFVFFGRSDKQQLRDAYEAGMNDQAARLSQDSSWQAIVQHCMVTEAVTPREDDPYGTINDIISWHVNADRLSQGEQGEAREPRGQYLAHITANQAQNLLDYFGGGSTTYTLIRCEAGDCAQDDGSPAPAGLYVYDANCPEEGVNYLGEEDEDSKPRDDDDLAERSAVPDGWVLVPCEPAIEQLEAIMSSYWGDGWDNVGDMREARLVDAQNMYDAMLTAAPQPPEGARVVDMVDMLDSLTDEQLMEFVAIGLRHAEVKNFQIGDLRPAFKKLKTMLAAPTLAGKEG